MSRLFRALLANDDSWPEVRREAMRARRDSPAYFTAVTDALALRGRYQVAAGVIEKALSMRERASDRYRQATLYAKAGDPVQAEVVYRRTLALKGDYHLAKVGLAKVLLAQGKPQDADATLASYFEGGGRGSGRRSPRPPYEAN